MHFLIYSEFVEPRFEHLIGRAVFPPDRCGEEGLGYCCVDMELSNAERGRRRVAQWWSDDQLMVG